MLIKLNVDGELLECLKRDSEINCRTNPQQILYYLRQIYNGQLSVSNNTQFVQIEVPTLNHEVQEDIQEVPEYIQQVHNSDNDSIERYMQDNNVYTDEDTLEIDEDILNF